MNKNYLEKFKFDELYTMSSGISSTKEQAGHGFPFVSFSTIFNNYFLPDVLPDLMQTSIKDRESCSVLEGDVFLTRTSETPDELAMSSVALKDYPNATFSGFAKRLRPINKGIVYPKYMAFYLRSPYFRKVINNNTIMTLRASFNEDMFSFLELYLPKYNEQVKIGDLLCLLEKKIQLNEKINNNLQAQINSIYNYWFTQFDFPNENNQPYCSSGGKMVWNDTLKQNIPENWTVKCVLDILSWQSNSQPPKSMFIYEPKDGYIRFIQNRDYDSDDYKTYIPKSKSLTLCNSRDILIDKYGDAGRVRYGLDGAFNVALAKLNLHDTLLLEYVRCYFESEPIYNYLHASCMASTRASLNESNIGNLYIVIPPQKLLEKFNSIVNPIRDKILMSKDENRKCISLRNWLLPMLINGQATIE